MSAVMKAFSSGTPKAEDDDPNPESDNGQIERCPLDYYREDRA
jgi:hypothetical protein